MVPAEMMNIAYAFVFALNRNAYNFVVLVHWQWFWTHSSVHSYYCPEAVSLQYGFQSVCYSKRKAHISKTHSNTAVQWHHSLRVNTTYSICNLCWAAHHIQHQASPGLFHCNNSHIPWQSVWNGLDSSVCVWMCVCVFDIQFWLQRKIWEKL